MRDKNHPYKYKSIPTDDDLTPTSPNSQSTILKTFNITEKQEKSPSFPFVYVFIILVILFISNLIFSIFSTNKNMVDREFPQIGVYVTTCKRLDLLNQTISTFDFYAKNDPLFKNIKSKIIVDDCNSTLNFSVPDGWTLVHPPPITNLEWDLSNRDTHILNANLFGYETLLKLMNYKLDYIVHLEDDWEFQESGFLDFGVHVLNGTYDKNGCSINSTNISHVQFSHNFLKSKFISNTSNCPFIHRNFAIYWGGWTWNAGLVKNETFQLLKKFVDEEKKTHELQISIHFRKQGKMIIYPPKIYAKHSGDGRSVLHKVQ